MKKREIPFWLQLAAILLAGVLLSCVAFFVTKSLLPKPQEPPAPKHTVTFAYPDGTVIETKEVTQGKGVFPPKLDIDGVFRGWSARINDVTCDIEAHPVYHAVKENNLFSFDSVYVQEGTEFALELFVSGVVVDLSSGELTLLYDPEVLEFRNCENMPQCTVTETAEGELKISFDSADPIRGKTLLSRLQFFAKEKDAHATEVQLQASNMKIVYKGEKIPADCATINNKVYFLQEVEP